ncbi:hypothetical protein EGH24_01580 [Halonotius terrestris]|uniref:Uncharacterized protein n=1 Tax=Halonotius terrestris TaxID=2487750 RepID=A0A8J8PBI9_9EURY|nr:hypothetical protein [Halonotius terrestris]TQQ83508.1 hypothetical protein EGH24_01580 [Halonotius terrestris]
MSKRLPTRRADLRLIGRTLRLVLSIPAYAGFAVLTAWGALTAFALSQNLTLTSDLIVGGSLPLADRLVLVVEQYPFVGTNYSALDGAALLLVVSLVGANLALVTYHLREHDLSAAGSGGSLLGVALGVLGAGCAACGSALLLGVLSLFGASGLVLLLPLGGLELSLLAVLALLLSTYWVADGMRGGEIQGCPVDIGR